MVLREPVASPVVHFGCYARPQHCLQMFAGSICKVAVGQNQWYYFGVGEFTTHFRAYFSGWIGMFTGGTIWILTCAKCGSCSWQSKSDTPPQGF